MKIDKTLQPLTGAAVPLGALRSTDSCGIGEYLDLIPLADLCKKAGLKIIQLLPVNDTGTESSPYSALSAFALHPIYISLKKIPEVATTSGIAESISQLKEKYEKLNRFAYSEIRYEKLRILRAIYDANLKNIVDSDELNNWIRKNPWIENYSVFMELKKQNMEASWKEWKPKKHPSKSEITESWQNPDKKNDHYFFAWVQMRLDQQFSEAANYVKKQGIILKGDIPIMMNEDSVDAWAFPEFFNDTLRAGSPPDGENPCGQNWGFPIYNWTNLRRDNYSWWKDRLKHAENYYQAYRIDHVLGFFRIWATPQNENTAMLGWTQPFEPIHRDELITAGFSAGRIEWLSKPHVNTSAIQSVNNNDYLGTHGILEKVMDRIGVEEMWLFKKEITGEKDIWAADIPDFAKWKLSEYWKDRTLIETSSENFSPLWTYKNTTAWKSLSEIEKRNLEELIEQKKEKMEMLWKEQAYRLLTELTGCVKMTACAEDLGAMPQSVPEVLQSLKIYGLRVVRWCRDWNDQNQPFEPLQDYTELSVTTTSVHDSTTLRQWWIEDPAAKLFAATHKLPKSVIPGLYTPKTAKCLLQEIAKTNSIWCIYPIQDFLALNRDYYADNPNAERVNIPGTVTAFNWTYRIPVTLEKIIQNTALLSEISDLVERHEKAKK